MVVLFAYAYFFFFKQKTAYELRISDWSSDVCSSDLVEGRVLAHQDDVHGGEVDHLRPAHGGVIAALAPYRHRARPGIDPAFPEEQVAREIGRASCRERVCQYV